MTGKISRRQFLSNLGKGALSIGALSVTKSGCSTAKIKKDSNVLLIVVDDLRPELGCYGAKHIHSPNIDNLAANGLKFNKAHIQQAVCAPSRASFLTGCRPDTTGVDFPYTRWFREKFLPTHPDIQTFFNKSGYYTTTFGKIHHALKDHPTCSEPHYAGKNPDWVADEHQHKGPRPCVEFVDKPDNRYQDGDLTEMAIQRIRGSSPDSPMFLAIGYKKPHLPFVCPKKYADLYQRDEIELSPVPQFPEGSPSYSHRGKRRKNQNGDWVLFDKTALFRKRYTQNPGGLTKKYQQELIHGYYACISFIDAQIGRLLNELKRKGIWENTIIVLWGDHGYHLGDHNFWTKGNNCEFDTHIPLIVRIPGQKNAGKSTDALVEAVDIYPTLLDACGFPVPTYMEGTSFLPLFKNPERKWKKAAFSQYPRGKPGTPGFKEGYTIRTMNYRYTEWKNNKGRVISREFYDYTRDALESKNLINEKEYTNLILKHKKILNKGWKGALPEGITNLSHNPMGDDSEYLRKYLNNTND